MAFKKSTELFGDNGPNGPRAPIDEAPGIGLGPKNRAVAFGEPLKSRTANRICYALALNDDDLDYRLENIDDKVDALDVALNARLDGVESQGLDGTYRRGHFQVPGGGRLINVDAGAVEFRSTHGANLARDLGNSILRVDATRDTGLGTVALDVVSRSDTAAALFGILDRRIMAQASARTKVAASEPGILRDTGSPANEIKLAASSTGYFSTVGTDLIPELDLVEVLDSAHRGLYVIKTVGAKVATLMNLDGTTPSFGAVVACTFRLCRPIFSSGGKQTTTHPALRNGVVIAGLPVEAGASGDSAALTLLARDRPGNVPSDKRLRYALSTRVIATDGTMVNGASITADGRFELRHQGSLIDTGYAANKGMGSPGYAWYQSLGNELGVGFCAHGGSTPSYIGVLTARRTSSAISGTMSSGKLRVAGAVGACGGIIEMTDLSGNSLGTFRLVDYDAANQWIVLTTLFGGPNGLGDGSVLFYVLETTELGRATHAIKAPLDTTVSGDTPDIGETTVCSGARITGPRFAEAGSSQSTSVLTLAAQNDDGSQGSYYLRCTDHYGIEKFAVTATGQLSLATGARIPALHSDWIDSGSVIADTINVGTINVNTINAGGGSTVTGDAMRVERLGVGRPVPAAGIDATALNVVGMSTLQNCQVLDTLASDKIQAQTVTAAVSLGAPTINATDVNATGISMFENCGVNNTLAANKIQAQIISAFTSLGGKALFAQTASLDDLALLNEPTFQTSRTYRKTIPLCLGQARTPTTTTPIVEFCPHGHGYANTEFDLLAPVWAWGMYGGPNQWVAFPVDVPDGTVISQIYLGLRGGQIVDQHEVVARLEGWSVNTTDGTRGGRVVMRERVASLPQTGPLLDDGYASVMTVPVPAAQNQLMTRSWWDYKLVISMESFLGAGSPCYLTFICVEYAVPALTMG